MLTLRAAFRKRLRKAASRPGSGYGPSRHPQSGKGMGVSGSGGVAKPGWATTKKPIPEGTRKVTGQERGHTRPQPHKHAGGLSIMPPTPVRAKIPADNPYAGGHKNVQAAVMKAVRMVAKHKDKRGSTAHHGGDGRRQLSVPETHQLRIARRTLEMNPAMVAVMGGPNIEESEKIVEELTGRPYKTTRQLLRERAEREAAVNRGDNEPAEEDI